MCHQDRCGLKVMRQDAPSGLKVTHQDAPSGSMVTCQDMLSGSKVMCQDGHGMNVTHEETQASKVMHQDVPSGLKVTHQDRPSGLTVMCHDRVIYPSSLPHMPPTCHCVHPPGNMSDIPDMLFWPPTLATVHRVTVT